MEIVSALTTVAAGNGVYDGSVIDLVTRRLHPDRPARVSAFPQLTARELDILDHIARRESNAAIADHYVRSLETVRNMLTQLGAASRAEAIVTARQAGLGA